MNTAGVGPMERSRSVEADLRAVRAESRALASSVSDLVTHAETAARDQLAHRPYATLAMALGVGYVLGGGLPVRLTALLASMGTRFAFEVFARELSNRLSPERSRPT